MPRKLYKSPFLQTLFQAAIRAINTTDVFNHFWTPHSICVARDSYRSVQLLFAVGKILCIIGAILLEWHYSTSFYVTLRIFICLYRSERVIDIPASIMAIIFVLLKDDTNTYVLSMSVTKFASYSRVLRAQILGTLGTLGRNL